MRPILWKLLRGRESGLNQGVGPFRAPLLNSKPPRARVTQAPVRTAIAGDATARVTQVPVRAAVQGNATARVTQVPVRVAITGYSSVQGIQVVWW